MVQKAPQSKKKAAEVTLLQNFYAKVEEIIKMKGFLHRFLRLKMGVSFLWNFFHIERGFNSRTEI